ncbi:hypothetical protein [Enterococcus dongliensis]|uniref:DUF3102 domain-containing protein n=1 Tax=Enterococcus dongliensis TaxID=2559925 RepID=A0ABU3ERU0_9ENTE|nr:hypothetical protein [Enterococcus dongliensis]MDT2597396.1 hypothetical protein [Enterococcus dongliensis]
MKNHLTSSFDYSLLDVETSDFLYEKENILIGIQSRYSREVGKVFFEAQQKLSNKGNGTFEKWYSSIGFKKQNVNNYINIYKNVQSLDEPSAEIFDSLPKSLQNEMSKPSSNQELNQKVFDGDITTHKQYKELEKQLKAKDEQLSLQAKMIDDLTEQEPEVIEKEVVVERIPADYETVKATNERLEKQLSSVRSDLKMKKIQYDLLEKNTESAKTLEANIKALQQKEKSIDQRVKATIEFNDLMREIETFFDTKMASLRFKPLINDLYDTEASNKLSEVVNSVDFWVSEMRKIIPNEKTKIIEGEIING